MPVPQLLRGFPQVNSFSSTGKITGTQKMGDQVLQLGSYCVLGTVYSTGSNLKLADETRDRSSGAMPIAGGNAEKLPPVARLVSHPSLTPTTPGDLANNILNSDSTSLHFHIHFLEKAFYKLMYQQIS